MGTKVGRETSSYMEKGIQTPMAQGRSIKIILMIKWIRTSRLSIENSLSGHRTLISGLDGQGGGQFLGHQVGRQNPHSNSLQGDCTTRVLVHIINAPEHRNSNLQRPGTTGFKCVHTLRCKLGSLTNNLSSKDHLGSLTNNLFSELDGPGSGRLLGHREVRPRRE